MASVFTQDSVLHFLQSSGGSVKNADLLLHFRNFLRDNAERNRNRELFKGFVNSVATVRQIDGVSHVVLRKKFRGHEEDSSGPPPVPPNPPDSTEHQQKLQQNQGMAPTQSRQDQRTAVLPAAGIIQLDDSNVKTPLNLKHKQPAPVNAPPEPSAGPGPKQPVSQVSRQESVLSLPEHSASFQSIKVGEQRLNSAPVPNDAPARLHKEIRENPPNQVCLHPPSAPHRIRHRQSYKSAISQDEDEDDDEEEDILLRTASAGETSINSPSNHKGRAISASSPCLVDLSGPLSCSFTSSEKNLPQIYIQPIEGEIRPPQSPSEVGLKEELHRSKLKVGSAQGKAMAISHNLSSEPQCFSPPPAQKPAERHDSYWDQEYTPPSRAQLETRPRSDETQRLPSSSSTNVSPLADARLSSSNWLLFDSSRTPGMYSSSVDLETREGQPVGVPMFQNPQNQQSQKREHKVVMHHGDSKSTVLRHHSTDDLYDDQQLSVHMSPLHCSTDQFHDNQHLTVQMKPWHLSTGDLYDDRREGELNNASISPPQYWQQSAVTRQINSHLRSRMCLSLGADLDQLYQMEVRGGGANEAARLNRLHQISSSLSLRHNLSSSSLSSCATPPRCHSPALRGDGEERTGGRRNFSTATPSFTAYHGGQSPVPLEPREHAWMVKGAEGAWPDIYLLFREDSSLLNRRDFISGFTVLHWIAKHGDHRVLNTLWYGVEKAGLAFEVNAKSTGGQTALHVAAIHGNKNVIRLLVKKFNADVRLRDTAGKRPWQYLSNASVDILELLGAAARAPVTTERVTGKAESSLQLQQQRRRRRHHLSSASSEDRLLKVSGMTKVKRSSSIAAFFKHRSLHRFYGNQAESAV